MIFVTVALLFVDFLSNYFYADIVNLQAGSMLFRVGIELTILLSLEKSRYVYN